MTAAVRLVTAYNIEKRELYGLTIFTLMAAVGHFATEWLIYGTASWESVRILLAFDGATPLWMLYAWSRGWYIH